MMEKILSLFTATFLAVVGFTLPGSARESGADSVKIFFRQSKIDLRPSLHGNKQALDEFTAQLDSICSDKIHYRIRSVKFTGGASPEGSIRFNRWLSVQRAATLRDYVSRYATFPDSLVTTVHLGRDWQGLRERVLDDPLVPGRDAVLRLLDTKTEPLEELKRMRAYNYLFLKHFPELRASSLVIEYDKYPQLLTARLSSEAEFFGVSEITPPYRPVKPLRHSYLALRTNTLYDFAMAPNLGAELWLGNNFSTGLDWKYAWMKSDRLHWYWRDYGGSVNLKYWFGKLSQEAPFQGHHIGAYAQVFTYDFEFGGKGVMGGLPEGSILDKACWILAADYGYSIPFADDIRLDFSFGLGFMGGEYREYHPEDGCYVWDATKRQFYFGPTKLDISLVWVLDFINKGGRH